MTELYFVSDIHIDSPHDTKATRFIKFLNDLKGPNQELYLLGDIFDLWVGGHPHFFSKYRTIVSAIDELVHRGGRVTYLEGNHDLYLKDFWEKRGVLVVHDHLKISYNNKVIWMEHGDKIDQKDYGYRFLRYVLRTVPIRKFLTKSLPGNLIGKIGSGASQASRQYISNNINLEEIKKLVRDYSKKLIDEKNVDFVITGHHHVRDQFNFDNGVSVNLGTWLEKPCCYKMTKESQSFINL